MKHAEWVLVAAGAASLLTLPFAPLSILALGLLWGMTRPPRRERWIVLPILVVLAAHPLATVRETPLEVRLQEGYGELWSELEQASLSAAQRLNRVDRLSPVLRFQVLIESAGEGGPHLLLLDPQGIPVAWGGRGVRHELPVSTSQGGAGFVAGFGSATIYLVRPLGTASRPWRLVVARTLRTDRLPFGAEEVEAWSLVEPGQRVAEGALPVVLPGRPTLVARPVPRTVGRGRAGALVVLALVALAGLRWLEAHEGAVVPAALATLVAAVTMGSGLVAVALLALGWLTAWLGYRRYFRGESGTGLPELRGAGAGALLIAIVSGARIEGELPDLGRSLLFGTPEETAVRVGLVALAAGLLLVAAALPARRRGRGWVVVVIVPTAAIFADRPAIALPLLVLGAASAAGWLCDRRGQGRSGSLLGALLFGALLAGVADEVVLRYELRTAIHDRLLPGLAPPDSEEFAEVRYGTWSYLAGRDVQWWAPRSMKGLELEDLAFVLWRSSPLARRDALSALVVETPGGEAAFSFGLPLDGLELSTERARWHGLVPPGWERLLVEGQASLRAGGHRFGRARFWLLPRPGFRLEGREEGSELREGLLRGEPGSGRRPEGLPDSYLYGYYNLEGRPLIPPWPEAATLDRRRPEGLGLVPIPEGRAWVGWREDPEGLQAVFLPLSTPRRAVERLGVFALGGLLPLVTLGLVAFLLALGRPGFRELLRFGLRSYSRRLFLVTTILLALPLAVLNLVFFRAVEEGLENEQRADATNALASAERVLGEYLLSLEPGFALDTTLDPALLTWLSRTLQRQVNLFWDGTEYGSSQPELFTAGLLTRRIPGEAYVDLNFEGRELAIRSDRAGDADFLELFLRLDIPGVPASEQRFVLSLPFLAQREEVVEEMDSLRRTVILATVTLLILLALAGARLAAGFTRPIRELVEGTRRIAAGARSLEMDPTDQELAALVEAIDDMAARIALARERLVQEKRLMERMVESITSGVISLDNERRVLMANRVARELLGVEPGRPLEEDLRRRAELAPVVGFLETVDRSPRSLAVRLEAGKAESREWTVVWVPLPGEGDPVALLVVEDVTEVLRAQRLEAWAEMARIIAHEIKNPLTPIRLSTELLVEVYSNERHRFDEVFERCTTNILKQVEDLRQIASEFSDYSQVLHLQIEEGDLAEVVGRVVEDYRAAPPAGIEIQLRGVTGPLPGSFDGRLLARTVRNLVENALRASSGGGEVEVAVIRDHDTARVTVRDRGPGISAGLLPRIFEPYFSTHEGGTGLGLAIARRIVEEHGGGIEARNRSGGGLEVGFTIPLR